MIQPHLQHISELSKVAQATGIELQILMTEQAKTYIDFVLNKFKPWKTTGHLSIGDLTKTLPTDEFEGKFSSFMEPKSAYIFFEQDTVNQQTVAVIENAQQISQLMENSYGMEYFISDEQGTFLIAVNWYSVEHTDNAMPTL